MTNLTNHQFAGDARVPFAPGGSGTGHVHIHTAWGTANLTVNSQQVVWKALKACYVKNFALKASDMDTHATPLLTLDVGTATDDDEFIAGTTAGQSGAAELTNTSSTGTATEAGFPLAADDTIIISVKAAAATAAAGTTDLFFDVVYTG